MTRQIPYILWVDRENLTNGLPRRFKGKKIHLPSRETQVHSLGLEDPLEKEMATHSSIRLGNPTERGDWWPTVHGVVKSRI